MNISLAILAAGFGTRMKSSTPKVLHKISGQEMIFHIIEEAKKLSDDIHVVLYHQNELIKEKIQTNFKNINYTIQDHQNFPGTGGALRGMEFKNQKVLVLCGDMPLVKKEDLEDFLRQKEDVVMSVFKAQNPQGYGRAILDENLHVKKIVEEKDANDEEKKVRSVNAGVYLFDRDFLSSNLPLLSNNNAQKEYYLTDLIEKANKIDLDVKAVFVDEDTFMGVNSKVHLARAEELMQKRLKEKFMNDGVIMRLPNTIYIDKKAKILGECVIENGVSIEGECVIEDCHIRANSVIESSQISNSSIGPMARIRPQSVIKNTHIGNFVEVKKSILDGVKAGHLSYLGDSEIGEGTNVGCGTITCNYDGVKKHKTIIGKNVFIGSDTQFVAPIKVEDEVIIAAGTTLTKDVKKGSLAINRAPLKMLEGFYEKHFNKGK
ncbi:MAG: UDP-N-acetylglucosamine diphosphorylase/glucosamine-1-phosphate N-acetyltransferase [Proteobacteria bacterium]|nr:MAG: UDP-N-acetylglucosamine diphosphorylase/glucosamine-1-phosphate N-acetyltransferase [Pseudomonadota bacterium]